MTPQEAPSAGASPTPAGSAAGGLVVQPGDASPSPVPTAQATATPAAVPHSTVARRSPGRVITLTWYCNATHPEVRRSRCRAGYPDRPGVDDLYAGVSPDLSHLRGEVITVCRIDGGCVVVRVIDCNCKASRAIDLYADAFAQIAALTLGRLTNGGTYR